MLYKKPQVKLYPVASSILHGPSIPTEVEEVIRVQTEEHGDVILTRITDQMVEALFEKYDRLFAMGADGVVVEKVHVTPYVSPEAQHKNPTTMEQYMARWVYLREVPEGEGETRIMEYGAASAMCILTRTAKGIIGDFVTEDVRLFYDDNMRVIRRYKDAATTAVKLRRREEERAAALARKVEAPVQQLDYDGKIEVVNKTQYNTMITCPCGNVRWVKPSDVFQVHECKPCIWRKKKARRAARGRENRRASKERIMAAVYGGK